MNGASSKDFNAFLPLQFSKIKKSLGRKAFIKNMADNPLSIWKGRSLVVPTQKLEHGKTRLILETDTLSYMAFEHLMGPIERNWMNRRIILDYSAGGHYGICKRVKHLVGCKTRVKLDYDDFNSQHTHESIKTLFEELIAITGYDGYLGEMLIMSFLDCRVLFKGKVVGYNAGTVASGHRCTTFINSVLNAPYCMCADPRHFR